MTLHPFTSMKWADCRAEGGRTKGCEMTVDITEDSRTSVGSTSQLSVKVLGELQVRVGDGSPIVLTRTVRRVTAILAGWPGMSIPRDRLVRAVWGAHIPSDAHNSLQGHVAALRRGLGRHWVVTTDDGYALAVDPANVDAERFCALAEQGQALMAARDFTGAHVELQRARALWRGVPYADVHDTELIARRDRLTEMHEAVREAELECMVASIRSVAEASRVVPWAKEEVARDPLRERRYVLLMRALTAAERPAEALAVFRLAESYLRSHGGLPPGPQLRAAHQAALAAREHTSSPTDGRAARA